MKNLAGYFMSLFMYNNYLQIYTNLFSEIILVLVPKDLDRKIRYRRSFLASLSQKYDAV